MVNEGKIPLPEGCCLSVIMDGSDPYDRTVFEARIVNRHGDTLFKLEDKRDSAASRILKRMCREIEAARKGLQPITGKARDAKEGELC